MRWSVTIPMIAVVAFLSLLAAEVARAQGPSTGAGSCGTPTAPKYCTGVHGSRPSSHGRPHPSSDGSGGSGGGSSGLPPNYATYCPQMIQTGPLVNRQQLCPARRVSTAGLAVQATNRLPIPAPAIRTAPARGKRELVGVPTWFWLDRNQWAARSATASAGGVSSTVTATAYELVLDVGDRSEPFTCRAPWTPYRDGGHSSCTRAFTHSGRYTVTATVRWAADWHGSDGNGGTLPTMSRTVQFPVQVVQARSELIANP